MDIRYDLDFDLIRSDYIIEKCRNKVYAQNLYAAMCNNSFIKGNDKWMTSWRGSGGTVADLRRCGEDYIDWYCSGMVKVEGYVEEGFITEEIAMDLFRLGWTIKPREMMVDLYLYSRLGEGWYRNIW